MAEPINILELKDISVRYTNFSLKGLNLHVRKGEIVALVGPNGAGKSTTFKIIMGLEQHFKGQVIFKGRDITELKTYKRARLGIGYIPQEPVLIEEMSVEDHIYSLLKMRKENDADMDYLNYLVEWLGIKKIFSQKTGALSGGEKKKV